jgi:hypothetical protein
MYIGEGLEYRPFSDLRFAPEAGRPREQVEITEGPVLRSCWSDDRTTAWLVPSTAEDPAC